MKSQLMVLLQEDDQAGERVTNFYFDSISWQVTQFNSTHFL